MPISQTTDTRGALDPQVQNTKDFQARILYVMKLFFINKLTHFQINKTIAEVAIPFPMFPFLAGPVVAQDRAEFKTPRFPYNSFFSHSQHGITWPLNWRLFNLSLFLQSNECQRNRISMSSSRLGGLYWPLLQERRHILLSMEEQMVVGEVGSLQ